MSYPNSLEYHLLSRCPVVDNSPSVCLFQGRFLCAPQYRDCSQVFSQQCVAYSFTAFIRLLRCFKSFRYLLVFSISRSKVPRYFRGIFTISADSQPETMTIVPYLSRKINTHTAAKAALSIHEGLCAEFTSAP